MTWTPLSILWSARSLRDMKALTASMQQRVRIAVEVYAATGNGDVKRMVGEPGYRIRVGDWRVRVEVEFRDSRLHVLRILKRGDAY